MECRIIMASEIAPTEATSQPPRIGVIDAFTELVERLWQYVHEFDDLPPAKAPANVVRDSSNSKLIERSEQHG